MNYIATLIVCIISILMIVFIISGMIWAYFSEKKAYNHGICPKCGAKLKCVATTLGGDRLYTCSSRYNKDPECDYDCWISYDVDN